MFNRKLKEKIEELEDRIYKLENPKGYKSGERVIYCDKKIYFSIHNNQEVEIVSEIRENYKREYFIKFAHGDVWKVDHSCLYKK